MPAPAAASCASARRWRRCWACRRRNAARCAATWAAISARATPSSRNTRSLPWAARKVGRPVKWYGDRTECFVSDYQGRDLTVSAELALDKDGNFLGLRGANISNVGAYTAHFTPLRKGLSQMSGVYRIPAVHFRGSAVLTNTICTTPYRSAGRPEAIYVIERLVDIAAQQFGFDRIELRRRNMVPADAFPYTNGVGITYDNGEYEKGMDAALALAGWPAIAARKAEAQKRGKLYGIGLANYIEVTGGFPRERAEVLVEPQGRVELVLGTMNSGQGHETSFAQLLTEWLGVPFESVDFVAHDTDRVTAGGGSHSGRSMRIASLAVGTAADVIVEKGRKIAAHVLEVSALDVEFARGVFTVKGTDRRVGIFEVAKAAATRRDLPEDLQGKLDGIGDETVKVGGFPSGTHICEVEIDPDTGDVRLLRWIGVDDVGLAVNPMILHGQTHGAAAQGIGQALIEQAFYDPASGQMLTASFMDYAMPRADFMPPFECKLVEIPATSHRYGIRPGGEGGTTPALGRRHQCRGRCAGAVRRQPCRDAGDARSDLARHRRGEAVGARAKLGISTKALSRSMRRRSPASNPICASSPTVLSVRT